MANLRRILGMAELSAHPLPGNLLRTLGSQTCDSSSHLAGARAAHEGGELASQSGLAELHVQRLPRCSRSASSHVAALPAGGGLTLP